MYCLQHSGFHVRGGPRRKARAAIGAEERRGEKGEVSTDYWWWLVVRGWHLVPHTD